MARIIVMPDPTEREETPFPEDGGTVLLDERVYPLHLDDRHAARQLIQRLAWAVDDAECARIDG